MARHLCTLLERTEFCLNHKGHFFSSYTYVRRLLIGTTYTHRSHCHGARTQRRVLCIIGFANKRACFNYAMFSFYHKVFLQKKHLKSCSFKLKNVNVVSVVVQVPTCIFPYVFKRGLTGKSVGFFRTIILRP